MQRESSGGRAVRGRRPSVPIPSRPTPRRARPRAEEPPPATAAEESRPEEQVEETRKAGKRRRKETEQEAQKAQRQLRPRPPVGPRTSFVFFCAAKSADVGAENPYASHAERHRMLAQMWRGMHMDEREVRVPHTRTSLSFLVPFHCSVCDQPYIARQKQDRIRYHREMTEFVRAVQLYEAQHSGAPVVAAAAPPAAGADAAEPPPLERSDTQGSVLLND